MLATLVVALLIVARGLPRLDDKESDALFALAIHDAFMNAVTLVLVEYGPQLMTEGVSAQLMNVSTPVAIVSNIACAAVATAYRIAYETSD